LRIGDSWFFIFFGIIGGFLIFMVFARFVVLCPFFLLYNKEASPPLLEHGDLINGNLTASCFESGL